MTLKVHGNVQSSNTRRVLLVLKEKNIPYELVAVDWIVAEHKRPEWLEFQPFAQMPYIEDDDGFILYESRAIARYLVAKYPAKGPALIPAAGTKQQALFEQAASIEAFNFDPLVTALLTERLVKPFAGQTTDETAVAAIIAQLEGKFAGYERVLSKDKYLAGDEVTLADLFHIPYLSVFGLAKLNFFTAEEEVKKWPNLARWANELLARDSAKSV
ncbi:glutathione S-transferase-like protein [Mycena alexandri]|uniref:glutathione transferase n=1 Tax=Mycena alexandri TaxID=1745969 RepID=A0AAD6WXL6_9AGAR|nr:glutathione S-transferase-like protein [Mycena alexandri]